MGVLVPIGSARRAARPRAATAPRPEIYGRGNSDRFAVSVLVKAVRETAKAVLVEFSQEYHGETETWVPQSQIHEDSEVWREGHEGTLITSGWFARKRGWVEA